MTAKIVETEAYSGQDPASHSARGKTKRSAPMFEEPGRTYVYFIYGMYEMLNFVTEPEDHPGAVLIRAIDPIEGDAQMKKNLAKKGNQTKEPYGNGPGRLTRALGIQMRDNRASLMGPRFMVCEDEQVFDRNVVISPRVGIREEKLLYWRFAVKDHPAVSRAKQNSLFESLSWRKVG